MDTSCYLKCYIFKREHEPVIHINLIFLRHILFIVIYLPILLKNKEHKF